MANATQTIKTAADQAADTGAQAFTAGKETFKKTVDTTVSAFGDLTAQSKKNVEAFAETASIAAEAAQTLSGQAVAFSKQAFEANVAVAKKIASAKTVQEAWDIQSGHAKSAMDQYMAEATRFNEALTSSVVASWKPINERVAAVVSQIQAR